MRGVLGVIVAVSTAACMQSGLTPCGDRYCPPDKACHEPSGGCYGPDQLAACEGLPDFTDCSVGNFAGYCRDGICLSPRCGDGVVQPQIGEEGDEGMANAEDPDAACRPSCKLANCGDGIVDPARGEICDDGNLDANDQCAPDCGSDQTCGNGIKDLNEDCDDANAVARDGCSACRAERLVVQQLQPNAAPRQRTRWMSAFDAARERVVVFGGRAQVGGYRNDTWEWDGIRWREIKTLAAPGGRENAGMAYDAIRHRIVLFGGFDDNLRDDTWQYDGASWTQLAPATKPPARRNHAMAFDAGRGQLILFGGLGATGALDDTWMWDGTTWTQLAPATKPPPLDEVAMAYDPSRGEIVMFGGRTGATTATADTWIWDGTTWTLRPTTTPPAPRSAVTAAWDAARKRVVIAAGKLANTALTSEIYEFDGTTWIRPGFLPNTVEGAAFAYDAARGRLVYTAFGATFTRPATGNFAFVGATPVPAGRMHMPAVYDPRRGRLVAFGGHDASFVTNLETWEWDGSRWYLHTATNPEEHIRPAMAYSVRDGVVLGSGRGDGNGADLWRWDGAAWTQLAAPDPAISVRYSASLAYDVARDRLMLYGGIFDGPGAFEWNGASWTSISTTPGDRHNLSLAYDPIRRRTLLIGGKGFDGNVATYEWDGVTWAPPSKDLGIFARGTNMVFDPYAKKLVYVFDPEDTGLLLADYDGATWKQRTPEPSLVSIYRPAVAFDAVRGELVLFGGRNGGNGSAVLNSTTVIGYQPNVAVEACTSATLDYDGDGLAGCADPDCDARCRPLCPGGVCPPTTTPNANAGCGDGVCDPIESCGLCPGDCGECPAGDCGDFRCSAAESTASCPGDCP